VKPGMKPGMKPGAPVMMTLHRVKLDLQDAPETKNPDKKAEAAFPIRKTTIRRLFRIPE